MTSKPIFKPTLILHGGAGAIHRSTLPPDLYAKYHSSLLSYLRSTNQLLENGARALDAAVHAVSLMEDDELFNCGRGSVFTSAGTIEMEASVMVTSATHSNNDLSSSPYMKRGAGVIGIRNVRHPIQLAKEVLLRTGQDGDGNPVSDEEGGSMHCQLSGPYAENLAREWGLEFKPDEWFWTKRRWQEHRRGLGKIDDSCLESEFGLVTFSQGTVGCVCLDQWGDLAVATSTGGLTNKFPGRVGDTPTLGAGFWAEAWDIEIARDSDSMSSLMRRSEDMRMRYIPQNGHNSGPGAGPKSIWDMTLTDCLPALSLVMRDNPGPDTGLNTRDSPSQYLYDLKQPFTDVAPRRSWKRRRAVAISGTGNGDSFLRTAAARTACAMMRFSPQTISLAEAVTAVAGAGGELQRSAGQRWSKTGEGEGGIIGIEAEMVDDDATTAVSGLRRGRVVFDFNCGGMFRAWIEEGVNGIDIERVMVFKEPYR